MTVPAVLSIFILSHFCRVWLGGITVVNATLHHNRWTQDLPQFGDQSPCERTLFILTDNTYRYVTYTSGATVRWRHWQCRRWRAACWHWSCSSGTAMPCLSSICENENVTRSQVCHEAVASRDPHENSRELTSHGTTFRSREDIRMPCDVIRTLVSSSQVPRKVSYEILPELMRVVILPTTL